MSPEVGAAHPPTAGPPLAPQIYTDHKKSDFYAGFLQAYEQLKAPLVCYIFHVTQFAISVANFITNSPISGFILCIHNGYK